MRSPATRCTKPWATWMHRGNARVPVHERLVGVGDGDREPSLPQPPRVGRARRQRTRPPGYGLRRTRRSGVVRSGRSTRHGTEWTSFRRCRSRRRCTGSPFPSSGRQPALPSGPNTSTVAPVLSTPSQPEKPPPVLCLITKSSREVSAASLAMEYARYPARPGAASTTNCPASNVTGRSSSTLNASTSWVRERIAERIPVTCRGPGAGADSASVREGTRISQSPSATP